MFDRHSARILCLTKTEKNDRNKYILITKTIYYYYKQFKRISLFFWMNLVSSGLRLGFKFFLISFSFQIDLVPLFAVNCSYSAYDTNLEFWRSSSRSLRIYSSIVFVHLSPSLDAMCQSYRNFKLFTLCRVTFTSVFSCS